MCPAVYICQPQFQKSHKAKEKQHISNKRGWNLNRGLETRRLITRKAVFKKWCL